MKKLLSLLLAVAGIGGTVSAQCAYNNTQTGVTLSPPTTVGVASQLSSCVAGGQFLRVSGLTVGASYTVSTCGDTDFDTQITVLNPNRSPTGPPPSVPAATAPRNTNR